MSPRSPMDAADAAGVAHLLKGQAKDLRAVAKAWRKAECGALATMRAADVEERAGEVLLQAAAVGYIPELAPLVAWVDSAGTVCMALGGRKLPDRQDVGEGGAITVPNHANALSIAAGVELRSINYRPRPSHVVAMYLSVVAPAEHRVQLEDGKEHPTVETAGQEDRIALLQREAQAARMDGFAFLLTLAAAEIAKAATLPQLEGRHDAPAPRDERSPRDFQRLSDSAISARAIRETAVAGYFNKAEARRVGGRWWLTVDAVCRRWPGHAKIIRANIAAEAKDRGDSPD